MSARTVVVVVPCFREEGRLRPDGFRALHEAGFSTLFVDDGSDDATWSVIEAICAESDLSEGLRLPCNVGKGEAVRIGLNSALAGRAEIVGYLDADLATPADEMVRIVKSLDDPSIDASIGSRVRLLGSEIRRDQRRHYLGRAFATAASAALRLPVYDTQCGAKAFRASAALRAATSVPFKSRWVFDVELLGRLLKDDGHRVIEIPLQRWTDVGGGQLSLGLMARAAVDLVRLAVDRRRVR